MRGSRDCTRGESPPTYRSRWHRFEHHTAELELELGAASMAELFAEAGEALVDLLSRDDAQGEGGSERTIELEARDQEALLVAWLNELIYLAEAELWVPTEVEVTELSSTAMRARCRGRGIGEAPTLVKAATYHGLHIGQADDGLRASVILDV